MKSGMKIAVALLLLSAFAVSSAGIPREWRFGAAQIDGLQYPHGNIEYRGVAGEAAPDGDACGEFVIRKRGGSEVPWALMIAFVSDQRLSAGTKCRYSFQIRSSLPGKVMVSCIQQDSPWKTVGNSPTEFAVGEQWRTVEREFAVDTDFDCQLRTPAIMVGSLPEGAIVQLGTVRFEVVEKVIPLALNPQWTLFKAASLSSEDMCGMDAVPESIGGVSGEPVELSGGVIDLAVGGQRVPEKTPAVLFNEFESAEDGVMQVGCAADYWFEFAVNGKSVYDTLLMGNQMQDYQPANHVFNFPVKKGRNLVAVRVLSGSDGWKFVCGRVPFRMNLSRITQVVRGEQWRPVKMDKSAVWDKRVLRPVRIDQWKRVAGSALDLSQYVRRYDIDRCGRLEADAQGRLRFADAPQEEVRLRGFNFVPGNFEFGFYFMSHQELEEYAEQIALSGMNVLRFHFLDGFLAGNGGLPKQGRDRRRLAEVALAQEPSELKIDQAAADRFWYFLKCLRDRGVYAMLDVFTSAGLFTEAVDNRNGIDEYARYRMFFDPVYRNHWKASLHYLLKTPNPYTGKALIDDPQLIGITCFNEQEHLFNFNGHAITYFTAGWRKWRNPGNPGAVPQFDGALLKADTADGAAARQYLRERIREMNRFYLDAVRDLGFKGFVTNWDMYMRNLEGEARSPYNAVAMHTYHEHPGMSKLHPATYRQRLTYGGWLRNTMTTVGQNSSIVQNNYIGRAASARVLGKPFFMTEYSHNGFNQYSHEAAAMWAAYASLQDWQMLAPHANLVTLFHYPFQPWNFDGAENLAAVMNSLFCAFGWQRGDIQSAKHAVSFHVPEAVLKSVEYTGAIGSGYNLLFMLTRIGSDYRQPENPVADLNIVPRAFVGARSMGMYVELSEEREENLQILHEQVANLRRNRILPAGNRTDVDRGIFESETGEICADIRQHTLEIDTPRFQAMVLKQSKPAALSALSVTSISTPCTIAAISLENERSIVDSKRILVVVGTMFMAENAVFSTENFNDEIDIGDIQQVMRSGQFRFAVKTRNGVAPKVHALTMGGVREAEIPVTLADGAVHFDLDTSALEYGTPYFEVVWQ